jgi:hypothetical protein
LLPGYKEEFYKQVYELFKVVELNQSANEIRKTCFPDLFCIHAHHVVQEIPVDGFDDVTGVGNIDKACGEMEYCK